MSHTADSTPHSADPTSHRADSVTQSAGPVAESEDSVAQGAESVAHSDDSVSENVDAAPLGPESLSWRYTGDWRNMLLIGRVGFLQLMLPELGTGVIDHSAFYTEPLQRVLRSLPPMAGMVYDGPAATETARWIRDLHKPIKGTDNHGRRYHALNPDVFFWAHATIHEHVLTTIEVFDHPLEAWEKEQLFGEMADVWRMFGLSMRPVPGSAAEFSRYFDRMCAERLEVTPAADALRTFVTHPGAMPQPWLPRWLWRPAAPVSFAVLRSLTLATLPPVVAAKLGLEATAGDRRRLRAVSALIRRSWPALPRFARYMPRARAAFTRERLAARDRTASHDRTADHDRTASQERTARHNRTASQERTADHERTAGTRARAVTGGGTP